MQLKAVLFLSALLFLTIASGCDDDSGGNVILPSNLQITITQNAENPAEVTVTATADNVAYYNFYFGDETPGTPVESLDGVETHVYKTAGTFTIKVNAHATANDLISGTKEVTISLEISDEGYVSPATRDGFTLMWEDNFEGTALNTANWNYEIGTGSNGWGNNELQYYRQENTTVADGFLVITAKKESFSGSSYTSSRLTTQGKKEFKYGRIDIRAKIPHGQGIWPALWMLGANISGTPWPACGEIDIMEMIGGSNRENTVHGTVHWSDPSNQHAYYGGSKTIASGFYSDQFHVYSIEWDESLIKWYVDDVFFHQIDITPAALSELHGPHFLIFNVAVGGNWPGSPNSATIFPQKMIVDYIRVFQE